MVAAGFPLYFTVLWRSIFHVCTVLTGLSLVIDICFLLVSEKILTLSKIFEMNRNILDTSIWRKIISYMAQRRSIVMSTIFLFAGSLQKSWYWDYSQSPNWVEYIETSATHRPSPLPNYSREHQESSWAQKQIVNQKDSISVQHMPVTRIKYQEVKNCHRHRWPHVWSPSSNRHNIHPKLARSPYGGWGHKCKRIGFTCPNCHMHLTLL